LAPLHGGRKRKTAAPSGFSATTTAGCRDTNAIVSHKHRKRQRLHSR
jgi:hypothetical protein